MLKKDTPSNLKGIFLEEELEDAYFLQDDGCRTVSCHAFSLNINLIHMKKKSALLSRELTKHEHASVLAPHFTTIVKTFNEKTVDLRSQTSRIVKTRTHICFGAKHCRPQEKPIFLISRIVNTKKFLTGL